MKNKDKIINVNYRKSILTIIHSLVYANSLAKECIIKAKNHSDNINIINYISDTITVGYLDLNKYKWLTKGHITNYHNSIRGLKSSMDNAFYNIIIEIEEQSINKNI